MKKFLIAILMLLSFALIININNYTVLAADNTQYQVVKDQSFYCRQFQSFYNNLVKPKTLLSVDGIYGPATGNAFTNLKGLVASNSNYCREFQYFYNVIVEYKTDLVVDGIYGPATKNALNEYENLIKGNLKPGVPTTNPYLKSKEFYCAEFQGFYNDTYKPGTKLVVDGLYGPNTENAYSKMKSSISSNTYYCRRFQDFYNKTVNPSTPLVVDGYIGPATLKAYEHYKTLIK